MKLLLPLLVLAAASTRAADPAAPPVRTANGLALPAPAGFVDSAFFFPEVAEYARIAAEADRGNRTLAYFVQPMPDGFGMEAFAKVSRRLDGRICDRSVLPELAKAFSDPSFDRKLEQGVKETSDRRSKGLSETFGVQESFGAPRHLPVHRTTPRSVHFSLTSAVRSVGEEGIEAESTLVGSCGILWVRGRLLSLNVSTSIADAEEPGALDAALAETRDAVRGWEAAVVASNALLRIDGDPVADPSELAAEDALAVREGGNRLLTARNFRKDGFSFGRLGLDMAIGAVVGGIVGLVNWLKKRRREKELQSGDLTHYRW